MAAVAQLLKFVPDELLVVVVAFVHFGHHLLVEHLGGVRPLLVSEGAAHHVAPELAAVSRLRPGPHVGESTQGEGDEGDHSQDALGVAGVEPGGQRQQPVVTEPADGGAQEGYELPTEVVEGAVEQDAEGDRPSHDR